MMNRMINDVRFNYEVAEILKNEESVYNAMIKINDVYAYATKGYYAEKDEEWIDHLCWENLKVLEDMAWAQFPLEEIEAQDLLSYMSVSELSCMTAEVLKSKYIN